MNDHTPGPWEVNGTHIVGPRYIVGYVSAFEPAKEREANARLLAAAPDLFAALSGMHEEFGENFPDGESTVVDMARVAIAKAIGEP